MRSEKLLLALALLLGVPFVPRFAAIVHAQEEDGEGDGPSLTEEQKKEIQSIAKAQKKANDAIDAKDYEVGVKAFTKLASKLDASKLPEQFGQFADWRVNAHYNLACCLSRVDKKDDAVKEFAKSVELGFFDWKHIDKDDDLDALRPMDSFKKAVEDGKKLEIEKLTSQIKGSSSSVKLDFDAKSDDKKLSVDSFKGKVLVAVLVLTKGEEMGHSVEALNEASKKLKDQGVRILGLVPGAAGAEDLADELGIKFPLASAALNESIKAAAVKGNFVIVVDGTGKVRATARLVFQAEALEAVAKALADTVTDPKDSDKKDSDKKGGEKKEEKKDF